MFEKRFKPAIPLEVIVDFSIHRGELVCSAEFVKDETGTVANALLVACRVQLVDVFGVISTQKPSNFMADPMVTKKEFVGTVWYASYDCCCD